MTPGPRWAALANQVLDYVETREEVKSMVTVGDRVIYVDKLGRPREALVTHVFGGPWSDHQLQVSRAAGVSEEEIAQASNQPPSLNLVFVSDDTSKDDSYGRQIERETSIVHQSRQPAHGNYWKEP